MYPDSDDDDTSFDPANYGDEESDSDDTYYGDSDHDDSDEEESDFELRVEGEGDGKLNKAGKGTRSDANFTKPAQNFTNYPYGPPSEAAVTAPVVAAVFSTAAIFVLFGVFCI